MSPFRPDEVNLRQRFARPTFLTGDVPAGQPTAPGAQIQLARHTLGTDDLGRDVMTRAMDGGRTTLGTGLVVATFGVILAVVAGTIAGLSRELWEFLGDLIGAFWAALPDVAILMLFAKLIGPLPIVLFILLLVGRLHGERVIRFANLANRDDGAQESPWARLPRMLSALGVVAALSLGWAVSVETAVSYLGLGVQPPTPSWGNMLSNAQQYFFSAPWLVLYPGMVIFFTVLGCNVIADGLRHNVDPSPVDRKIAPTHG